MSAATETLNDVPTRVARGAALLDEQLPGWAGEVNTDLLDVRWDECVLFQLGKGKGFAFVARQLGVNGRTTDHGFFWRADVRDEAAVRAECDLLNAEWERVIRARREGGAP